MSCSGCKAPASAEPIRPPWRNIQVVTSALSGVLLAPGFFGSMLGLPAIPETSLYLLAIAVGGRYFIYEGIETLLQE